MKIKTAPNLRREATKLETLAHQQQELGMHYCREADALKKQARKLRQQADDLQSAHADT